LPSGVALEKARGLLVENLRYAAEKLAAANVGALLEPVNSRAIPGFFVDRPSLGFAIVAEVGSPNLKVQYDIFHAQVMEGDLANTMEREWANIGHIQIADNPGRHEPGTGEINYPFLFKRIDERGFKSAIGCEYVPRTTTAAGLGWLRPNQTKQIA
jgi:hydroxypyruvate isomerase